MSWIEMQVATVKPTGRDRKFAYEIEISLNSPGESKSVMIPEDISTIAVALFPENGASGLVEYTLDHILSVKADIAEFLEWDLGEVTENTADVAIPVTAIRLKQISNGDITMKVRAQ